MYGDLAPWWPLLSPPEDYAEESAMINGLLRTGSRMVRTVLDLGSGGGHVASHLSSGLEMTLVDLSPQMVDVSRRLNPACEHVVGDMRTLRLDRRFDAVLVHDSIDYLLDESEVAAMAATVVAHLEPGGVAVMVPDHTTESFEPSTDWGGSDAADGRGARYLEWTWDPDPRDSWAQAEYVLVLRETDGTVSTTHESHRFGLFSHQQWITMLGDAGLSAVAVLEQTDEERPPRTLFVARA
jgi:trans-aconitate methyltransferase